MTDKQIIECKYKFQSIEKFAGKPYCTLHNETCEFINFVCDKNCQVYEDYKQLARKEQECEELKATLKAIANRPCLNINDCDGNCLPHCKWNAHKLAQQALEE